MFVKDMLRLLAVRGDPRGHLAPHEKMEQHPSRAEDVMSTPSMKSLPVVDGGVISVQVPR